MKIHPKNENGQWDSMKMKLTMGFIHRRAAPKEKGRVGSNSAVVPFFLESNYSFTAFRHPFTFDLSPLPGIETEVSRPGVCTMLTHGGTLTPNIVKK